MLSENELKAKSINDHIKGNLAEAEKGYITFLRNGFSDADVFSNYALICEEKGDTDQAIKLYERCNSYFPNHIFSKLNLSFLYYKLNNFTQAELIVEEAIKLKPELANGYCIKGLILKSLNKYFESKKSLEKAIEMDNNYLDAYINLGLLNKDYNNFDDAEKYYLKAIELNKESAIAHLNLGACYKEKQQIEKAILHTEKAIKIDSKLKNSYLNLATIYNLKGDFNKSISLAKKELRLCQDNQFCYQLISDLITKIGPLNFSRIENRELLSQLLDRKDISHRELFGIINNIFSSSILENLSNLDGELDNNNDFNILMKDKELLKALSLLIFCSPLWEKALRNLRKIILLNYSENKPINNNLLNFTISLGSQCFLNEYVYYVSDIEKEKIKQLKERINDSKNLDYKLAIISCYQPLFSINKNNIILSSYKSKNQGLNNLINLQFRELIIEQKISTKILKVGKINDLISKKVKDQYESNPYPRWRYNSYAKENKINFESVINSEIYPSRIKSNQNQLKNKKLNILIAGCGTGIQILEASRYSNCEITAIDLSNSSISYAKRKVDEYGMKNINFIEMDILELTQLGKRFDLIECSGVLHHMKDPSKGLSSLVESLEPNGFLKLGLYSMYARIEILKARDLIRNKKLNPNIDEIRSFRNNVINEKTKKLVQITNWSDFYSTSMCRDLCFHSQEKCFSLLEIKNLLDINNLEFLGFTLSKNVKDKYQQNHKDIKSLNDLQLWDKFEILNPNSFKEMYQFWTRKSIK